LIALFVYNVRIARHISHRMHTLSIPDNISRIYSR